LTVNFSGTRNSGYCAVLKGPGGRSHEFPVATARGKHLFPFRTEQLSPSAPMVLGPQGPGRVGRRRFNMTNAVPSGTAFRRSGRGSAPHDPARPRPDPASPRETAGRFRETRGLDPRSRPHISRIRRFGGLVTRTSSWPGGLRRGPRFACSTASAGGNDGGPPRGGPPITSLAVAGPPRPAQRTRWRC